MRSNSKHNSEELEKYIELYLDDGRSYEKLRAENAALKARNEYLETENAALRKLEEVERELMSRKRGMRRNTKRSRNYKKKDSK